MDVSRDTSVRVDKWLWSVRICKTRPVASEMCQKQRVTIAGQPVKPSRDVRIGQVITVRKDGINWQFRVLKCIVRRVGAAVAKECYEDLTPQAEKDRLELIRAGGIFKRPKGEGRPTKKDRRAVDRLMDL